MSPERRVIRVDTSEGQVVAERRAPHEPWRIRYPWGEELYYGREDQVRSVIEAAVDVRSRAR